MVQLPLLRVAELRLPGRQLHGPGEPPFWVVKRPHAHTGGGAIEKRFTLHGERYKGTLNRRGRARTVIRPYSSIGGPPATGVRGGCIRVAGKAASLMIGGGGSGQRYIAA